MPGRGSGRACFYHRYPGHIDPAKGFSVTEKNPIVDRTVQALFLYRVDIMGFFDQTKKELQLRANHFSLCNFFAPSDTT
jgi:hypothetical protein